MDEQSTIVAATPEIPTRRPRVWDRDWQKALIVLLTILAACAVIWVAWQILTPIFRTILLFVLAGVLTFMLAPPVNLLERRVGHRMVAIIIVYAVAAGVLVGGLLILAGPFVSQATTLAANLPAYVEDVQRGAPELQGTFDQYGIPVQVRDIQQRLLTTVNEKGGEVLSGLVGTLGQVGGLLVDVVLALVVSFYLLLDGPSIRRRILALIPEAHHGKAKFFEVNANRVLGGYLRGQLIMAAAMGVLAGVGVAFLGLPYAVVLGVLAGLFALVPMFGPILAAVPAVLVGVFQPFPTVIWVIIYFVVISQIVTNIIGPRITGQAVGLHPLAAMFALLAGFQMAGFLGGLFAVPLAGIVWVFILAAYRNVAGTSPKPSRGIVPRLRRRPPPISGPSEPSVSATSDPTP